MTCTACNAEIREGASRCVKCGARPGEPPPAERSSSGRLKADAPAYPRPTRTGATVWQVTTDKPHTIELELSLLSGREIVVLDGRELVNAIKWSFRSEHLIPLGSEEGALTVSMGLAGPTAALRVGGRDVAPVSTATFVQAKGGAGAPAWAYVFAAACMGIPIVAMGGAVPMGLGFGGAAGCISIARNQTMSVGSRIALCALVTICAWGGLAVLLVLVFRMTNR